MNPAAEAGAVPPAQGEILFFLRLNDRGGAEISMLKIARGIAARGRKVTLAVYGTQAGLARELGFPGDIIDLGAERTLSVVWPLYRLLRAGRFAHLISALTHTNIAAVIASAATGCLAQKSIRVIATEHGNDGITACAGSSFFRKLTRACYGRAAAVVAVSQGLADQWRGILTPQARVVAIYNPVIPDEDRPMPPPARAWMADRDIKTVIGIGRLVAEKNFGLLVRAFAAAAATFRREQFRELQLVILGEGDQRGRLEHLIEELGIGDKVLMPGFEPDPAPWLAYAALFVSSSQREGFGNAIVEALAQGVPVVATDCPYGPAEILGQGRWGRLIPAGDLAELTRAMLDGLDDEDDNAKKKAEEDRRRARAADFKASRCIDLYIDLIDNRG
jgi:glycosyltransferase involved in cell wall biosynthesis